MAQDSFLYRVGNYNRAYIMLTARHAQGKLTRQQRLLQMADLIRGCDIKQIRLQYFA